MPSAHGPGGGHRGSRETIAAGARPPLPPEKRVGCRPKRLHSGSGTSWWEQGAGQNMSLLVLEFGVCHPSFLAWPSACTPPPMLPREGATRRRGGLTARGPGSLAVRLLPCGTCLSVPGADRCVRQGERGWGGRSCQSSVSPAQLNTCHCMQPVGVPACCEEPRIHPIPVHTLLPSSSSPPYLFCQKDPVRLTALSSEPSHLWGGYRPPSLAAQADALGLPKPKIRAELAQMAPCVPLVLLWPCREWPLVLTLRQRLVFPD